MSLSNRFQILRKKFGLTQAEFAEQLGISLTAYKNYENGTRDPSASVLMLLCTLYDVVPAWLLKGAEDAQMPKILDVGKTELVFKLMQFYKTSKNIELTKKQEAKLFNIIYEKIWNDDFDGDALNNIDLDAADVDASQTRGYIENR